MFVPDPQSHELAPVSDGYPTTPQVAAPATAETGSADEVEPRGIGPVIEPVAKIALRASTPAEGGDAAQPEQPYTEDTASASPDVTAAETEPEPPAGGASGDTPPPPTGGDGVGTPEEGDADPALAQLADQCRQAIELAPDYYGRIRVEGVIFQPGNHTLAVTESEVDEVSQEDVEAVQIQAVHHIARYLVADPGTSAPLAEPADAYYVRDDVTYEPTGGHIGVQHIRRIMGRQDAGELVTATTMGVPSDGSEESLYAVMYSRGGQVEHAEIVAMPAAEQLNFDACSDMFGDETRATQLFQGVFADEAELDGALQELRSSALAVGVYPEAAVDQMLGHIRRNGLAIKQDREQNGGVRPERLARLQQLADALSDAGV